MLKFKFLIPGEQLASKSGPPDRVQPGLPRGRICRRSDENKSWKDHSIGSGR